MAAKKTNAGPRKVHGPKKRMFHCWDSTTRLQLSQCGLLKKYSNMEAWAQACLARGKKNVAYADWAAFCKLKTKSEKDEWFKSLKK